VQKKNSARGGIGLPTIGCGHFERSVYELGGAPSCSSPLCFAENAFGFRDIDTFEFGANLALGLCWPMDHNHEAMLATEIMRTSAEVAAVVGLTGLVIYAWLRLRRRSWPVSRQDESMRRHIDQHYS
jgi:hypothetical protein